MKRTREKRWQPMRWPSGSPGSAGKISVMSSEVGVNLGSTWEHKNQAWKTCWQECECQQQASVCRWQVWKHWWPPGERLELLHNWGGKTTFSLGMWLVYLGIIDTTYLSLIFNLMYSVCTPMDVSKYVSFYIAIQVHTVYLHLLAMVNESNLKYTRWQWLCKLTDAFSNFLHVSLVMHLESTIIQSAGL